MAYTIAFFGTKPYDESSFNDKNKEFGFEIRYYKGHLNKNNVLLTQGVDAVCIFVNDVADAEVIRVMAANGVKLLALRCAGFNNVDLDAAADAGITVVRVPAYSPYAVAEYTVALMLSLNRKIPRASWRTKDGNFLPARPDGIRHAWKNSRHHRHRKNSENTDSHLKRVWNERIGLRPLSGP